MLTTAITVNAANNEQAPIDEVLLQLEAEDYVPYSAYACDEDDEEEDIPENEFKTIYEDGRMAFLFGQYKVAYKAWWPLAQKGFAKAQAALAWMYHTGNGAKIDAVEAVKWYSMAAAQGHRIAQNNLAVMYEDGLGVSPNEKTAAEWYRKSADLGYANAQYNLGQLYAEGRGVQQDSKKAKYWYRVASRQGIKKATLALAVLEATPALKVSEPKKSLAIVAHTPYHGNPVAKGLAWIKQQKKDHYTIQLAHSQDENWILKLAASQQLPQPLVKFKTENANGNVWHTLIYGSFPNKREAEAASKALPRNLRKWSPWLRQFKKIHQLLPK